LFSSSLRLSRDCLALLFDVGSTGSDMKFSDCELKSNALFLSLKRLMSTVLSVEFVFSSRYSWSDSSAVGCLSFVLKFSPIKK